MASQKLSRPQIEFVLKRAAELETVQRDREADHGAANEELSVGELVRLGEEAGLGSDAIMRALADLRRGIVPSEEQGALARALGPSRIVVSREVPGPLGPVDRAVQRFLREQLLTIRRHHGERIEWERAHGLWPGLVRSLDFARRYAFGPVSRVQTVVMPATNDSTSVTFEIDLSEMRQHRMARMILRSAAAFGLVGLGGAALLPGFGVPDLVALFSGGAAAGGLVAMERRRFDQIRERVTLAPERFLDLLVQRRMRVLDRGLVAEPDTNQDE